MFPLRLLSLIILLSLPGRICAQPPAQPSPQTEAPAEGPGCVATQDGLSFVLDLSQQGVPLPRIFYPSIDLSGRGFNADITWPQTLAAPQVLDTWQREVGFRGMYRLQFNLWEISQLNKNRDLQGRLLANYESVLRRISEDGGTVILNIYSVPQGQGKVLDKTSFPADLAAFKQQVKEYIRHFSCVRKYNVWYEVWNAPDLDDFFLGRKNEYLTLYRCVAEAVKELQAETRRVIPVGGPSASWWFRSFEENTILTPERSLIYELIKYCYRYKLPLDFISWHAYSTDPHVERELTAYHKKPAELIRDWLGYFGFPRETPLIVDEWNFDNGLSNVLEERQGKGNVCASYLVSRLRNMFESGLDYQVFFSLEDFQENREGVVRNVGAFWYDAQSPYAGGGKNIYAAFRMLAGLGKSFLPVQKSGDEFTGVIASRDGADFVVIVHNYADPEIFRSTVSRGIAALREGERRSVLNVIRSDQSDRIISGEVDPASLRLPGKTAQVLKKAQERAALAGRLKGCDRQLQLTIKNLPAKYTLRRYVIDERCSRDCPFLPVEETQVAPAGDKTWRGALALKPYSVTLLLLKPAPPPAPQAVEVKAPETVAPEEAVPAAAVPAVKEAGKEPAPLQADEVKLNAAQEAKGQ